MNAQWSRWLLLGCFLLVPPLVSAISAAELPVARIGFIVDGVSPVSEVYLESIRTELTQLLASEWTVVFPDESFHCCGETPEALRRAVDLAQADASLDLVIAVGLAASNELASRGPLPRPSIASLIIDHRLQGVPFDLGASGTVNLSYIEAAETFQRDMEALRAVAQCDRVAVLVPPVLGERVAVAAARKHRDIEALPLELELVVIGDDIAETVASIPGGVDGAYLIPLAHEHPRAFSDLVDGLHARGIATFSVRGQAEVELGALMGLTPEVWLRTLARRVALNAQKMLDGQDGGTLPVSMARQSELFLNLAAARTLGLHPTFAVLNEATLVGLDDDRPDRTVTLTSAIDEALAGNRDLLAASRTLEAARHDVSLARATLLPQIDVLGVGTVLDQDRAEASMGSAVQRTLSGEVQLQQVLWSEAAWAGVDVQKKLLAAEEASYEQSRLDVVLDVTTGYLNLLSAKSSEQILRENLKLIRSNLEHAEVRVAAGVGNRAEVLRWQSEIATARSNLIEAVAGRNAAEIDVNRILHRPLEESFATVEVGLRDRSLSQVEDAVLGRIDNPWGLRVFRAFLSEQALRESPELLQLDAALAAQQRLEASASRAFYSPTVALNGAVSRNLARGGAGAELADTNPPDDTDWNLSLSLSLPLFEGGARLAERRQASAQVRQLELEREAAAERIEQRVRTAVHFVGSSLASVSLSREAAEAARENLDLMADGYASGVVSILDLLDAQNAFLAAEQSAASAVYEYFRDIMEAERAVGSFAYFSTDQSIGAWLADLDAYFQAAEAADKKGS